MTTTPEVIVSEITTANVAGGRIYASSSLGRGANVDLPVRPYIVWNELPSQPAEAMRRESTSRFRTFTLYVYDDEGDWARIDSVLGALETIVKAMAPRKYEDGFRITDSDWRGSSGHIADPAYHLNCKFGTARFLVNR